jgi:hypothetical protein
MVALNCRGYVVIRMNWAIFPQVSLGCGLLGCSAVKSSGWRPIPMFFFKLEDGASMFLLKPRRPQSKKISISKMCL